MIATTNAARLLQLVDGQDARDQIAAIPDLEELLADQLADARATWAGIELSDDAYLSRLARVVRDRSKESAERVVRTLPASDLYLAAACDAGDDRAIATFRAAFLPQIRDVLARLGAPVATIDETEQRVLEMLFVAMPGARAQIATYSARGRLLSWVRSVAVRTGRRLMGITASSDDDTLDRLPATVDDPQIELLRTQYAGKFRDAFVEAFARLTERERNLLRQYHVDELTIDQLAVLYRVNRATTARWVIAARGALLEATRALLAAELSIEGGEVDSIIRVVRSRIDLSIRELFAEDPGRG